MRQPRYRIQAVTQRTGIPSATLRAWERRYGFPKPSRAEGSTYRLYSEQDIIDVLEIKALCESGMSPSDAVNWLMSNRELGAVNAAQAEDPPQDEHPEESEQGSAQRALRQILAATRRFDHQRLERAVRDATLIGSGRRVFEEVFGPALREIGDEWHQGSLSIAQEHLATELIESATRDMLRVVQPDNAPTVLLACVQDEQHVLPLYGSAFLFTQWGFRVALLGSNTPPEALEDAVRAIQPQAVGLSVTQNNPELKALWPRYAQACVGIAWLVGGMSVADHQAQIEELGGRVVSGNLSLIRAYLDSNLKR